MHMPVQRLPQGVVEENRRHYPHAGSVATWVYWKQNNNLALANRYAGSLYKRWNLWPLVAIYGPPENGHNFLSVV